jgi:hypothetical protein
MASSMHNSWFCEKPFSRVKAASPVKTAFSFNETGK